MDEDGDHTHLDIHTIEERIKAGKPVIFRVKYEGSFFVSESRGVAPVRVAFKELRKTKEERRKRGIRHSPIKEFIITLQGVKIRDPVTKEEEISYEIRHISYIVNDERNRNYVGMIAQLQDKTHYECTIFKQDDGRARELVQSLGHAFDGAYLERVSKSRSNSTTEPEKPTETSKIVPEVNLTSGSSDNEAAILRKRLCDISLLVPQEKLQAYLRKQGIKFITEIQGSSTSEPVSSEKKQSPIVGRRLENLLLNDEDETQNQNSQNRSRKNSVEMRNRSQSDAPFSMRHDDQEFPKVMPPPRSRRSGIQPRVLSTISVEDPFEMGNFNDVSFPDFDDFNTRVFDGFDMSTPSSPQSGGFT